MVWEYTTVHSVDQIYKIDGTMDLQKQVSMLQNGYPGTIKDLQANPHDFILQADNDSKHRSKATQPGWEKKSHLHP